MFRFIVFSLKTLLPSFDREVFLMFFFYLYVITYYIVYDVSHRRRYTMFSAIILLLRIPILDESLSRKYDNRDPI